ncbi:MAG: hypothetical protein AB8G16_01720 [Gammaproteobacteria bacterium]
MIKIKRIFAASALGAMLMMGVSAQASTVQLGFSGVLLSCPDTDFLPCGTDLFAGDAVSGTIIANESAVIPDGGQIGTGDIVNYDFNLGGALMINSGNSTALSSTINLDDNLEVTGGSLVVSADNLFGELETTMVTLNFGSGFWNASVTVNGETFQIANGAGKLAVVPVPGALLLFGPALLGFLGLRRKA